jgi:hypothetical protein
MLEIAVYSILLMIATLQPPEALIGIGYRTRAAEI